MAESNLPTFEFTDGVLSIDTKLIRMRLRWRPVPLAEELFPGARRWRPCWPEFRLLRPVGERNRNRFDRDIPLTDGDDGAAAAKAAAFTAFRDELPGGLVSIVEPFSSHQWALLVFLHKDPRAIDLARSNPVLAHALASSDLFRGTPPDVAATQALWHQRDKQRHILAWLGFPDAESVVRLIRRISVESASPPMLRRLRNALNADARVMELLVHLPVIDADIMEMVTHGRLLDYITPDLLRELTAESRRVSDLSVGDILLEALSLQTMVAPGRTIRPFRRIEQIERFSREMHGEYQALQDRRAEARRELARRAELRRLELREQRRTARQARDAQLVAQREANARRQVRQNEIRRRPFPAPPIPGTPDIDPITSEEQLKAEGRLQTNCVGTYGPLVKGGSLYIYRVIAPERATLAIRRTADGCWRRSELKARANRRVRPATARAVDAWLARYRVSV